MPCTAIHTYAHISTKAIRPPYLLLTSGMIDRAFTATHRLFSHTDCPACVCVCALVCVWTCSMWVSLMFTAGRELCISLVCAFGRVWDRENTFISLWDSKSTLRLKVAALRLNDGFCCWEKRGWQKKREREVGEESRNEEWWEEIAGFVYVF